ncbi:glycosyltransferase family 4 protein, partial [Photorhabdus aegyptia]|uniref:glycosyltransferase family 4 protein n=1 Tax=Photorhabdus aegyptia TaxID=2805098 RepID=UPI001E5A28C0
YNTGPFLLNTSAKKITIIHDLIFMRPKNQLPTSTSLYQNIGRLYRKLVVPQIAKKSDYIITVSDFTKKELIEFLNIPIEKITVIPNSITDSWFNETIPLSMRKSYIFTVAGEAPSKNVDSLLIAFSKLIRINNIEIDLHIAGINKKYHNHFHQKITSLGVEKRVKLLDFLSEEELKKQYREARLFVFASLLEGFGIPLLEAMASGTPICCSNTTSIPEIASDAAIFFNPKDTGDIMNKIGLVLALSNEKTEELISKGKKRATQFSNTAVQCKIEDFWNKLL